MISFQVSQGPGTVWPSGMYKLSTNQEQDISGISDVPKVPAWKSLPFCLGRNESRSGDLLSPWSCPVLNIAKTACCQHYKVQIFAVPSTGPRMSSPGGLFRMNFPVMGVMGVESLEDKVRWRRA